MKKIGRILLDTLVVLPAVAIMLGVLGSACSQNNPTTQRLYTQALNSATAASSTILPVTSTVTATATVTGTATSTSVTTSVTTIQ